MLTNEDRDRKITKLEECVDGLLKIVEKQQQVQDLSLKVLDTHTQAFKELTAIVRAHINMANGHGDGMA